MIRDACSLALLPPLSQKLGVHGLVWDEALKLGGQDPDFHRRDLNDAIEAGAFPEWELAVQIISEEDEDKFDFSVRSSTRLLVKVPV